MRKRRSKYSLSASLQPGCNSTEDVLYFWEVASVDRNSGLLNQIYQIGKQREQRTLTFMLLILRPPGLTYIRCLARHINRMSAYRFDFGFIETMYLHPLHCSITPRQGRAILEKFTLNCTSAKYGSREPTGYQVSLDSRSDAVVIPEWQPLNGTIRLPLGNPEEGYRVRLKVEAKFLSLPSVFDDVVVKVGYTLEVKSTNNEPFSVLVTFNHYVKITGALSDWFCSLISLSTIHKTNKRRGSTRTYDSTF